MGRRGAMSHIIHHSLISPLSSPLSPQLQKNGQAERYVEIHRPYTLNDLAMQV